MLHNINILLEKSFRPKTKNNKAVSRGRTMTEMLGVLAIVGILSIGALAGYRYGMDKHRANATINDINLRGVDLIIQASRNIPLNLDEWGDKSSSGYTFGTPEWTTEGTIALDISGLPERVCEMVVDGLSSQFDMDINGARIDTDATCGEENKITVYFEGGAGDGAGCEGVVCPECQVCKNGSCTSSPDNMTCSDGFCESGLCVKEEKPRFTGNCTTVEDCDGDSECVTCYGYCDYFGANNGNICHDDNTGEEGICYNGDCQVGHCSSNDDCASGYFCADTNESCSEAHPNKCQKLDFVRANIFNERFEETTTWSEETTTLEGLEMRQKVLTLSDGTSEIWYVSNRMLSWWDAKNACEKLGKRMAKANEIFSNFDGTQCHGTYILTDRGSRINGAFGTIWGAGWFYWLSDTYDSCQRFVFHDEYTGCHNRNGLYLALCH